MQFLVDLWLAIIVCAAALFVCSFLVWAVLPHHRDDWEKLPDEEGFRNHLKALNLPPGMYIFPKLGSKECNTPEGKAKFKNGPSGELRVWKDAGMGKNMFLTFLVFLVASFLTAYVAYKILPSVQPTWSDRFQVIGTIGILTWCFSFIPNMIWFQASKRLLVNCIIDGLLYGLVTGAVFSWMWPAAVATPVP